MRKILKSEKNKLGILTKKVMSYGVKITILINKMKLIKVYVSGPKIEITKIHQTKSEEKSFPNFRLKSTEPKIVPNFRRMFVSNRR